MSFKTLWMDAKTSNKTDFFYTEIATTYIEEVKDSLEYTYFNLQDYQHLLDRTDSSASRKLIELYKIFSDTLSFEANRSKMTAIRSTVDSTLSCYTLLVLRNAKRIIKP